MARITGPFADAYSATYAALAETHKPKRCLEVGLETGQSAEALLLASPKARLLSVDISPCDVAKERLEEAGVANRWKFIQGNSHEVVPTLANDYYDWIYVDGDHSYDAVLADLRNTWKKLKPGGVLVADDGMLGSVSDALSKFGRKWTRIAGHPHVAMWIRKPKTERRKPSQNS